MIDLERFQTAQDTDRTYERALTELASGRKTTHWMWFVFPQLAGLGHSPVARRFAVPGLADARTYLAHPVLGDRLHRAARAAASAPAGSVEELLGAVDALKLRSSMTLFLCAADGEGSHDFAAVLARWYGGDPDPATVALLAAEPAGDRTAGIGSRDA